jgi:uncharacterized delta-60 repeat protein
MSNGQIVAGGETSSTPNTCDFALARYNLNGSLDTNFGADGKVITDFNSGVDWIGGVALQNDGQIVAVGVANYGPTADFALARYNGRSGADPTGTVSIDDTTPTEDQLLTAANTLADADGLGPITYTWQRADDAAFSTGVIAMGTGATFTPGDAEVGKYLRVTASYTDGQGTAESVDSAVTAAVIKVNDLQTVTIDVKPGSDPSPINLASGGVIPVVIYSTADFDASGVDIGSVVFAGAHATHAAWQDVNRDGALDLVLQFRMQDTDLLDDYAQLLRDADQVLDGRLDSTVPSCQLTDVSLSGRTLDDVVFQGFDRVNLFLSGKALRDLLETLAAEGRI